MFLTLGEAAKQTGISKATISRAIRDGKLSAQKSVETGSYRIDPAELCRYSEAVKVVRATGETEGEKQSVTVSSDVQTPSETVFETRLQEVRERMELEARAKLAEERLADLRSQLEEMRAQRDKWQEQAARLALPAPAPTTPVAAPARRWWWRRTG